MIAKMNLFQHFFFFFELHFYFKTFCILSIITERCNRNQAITQLLILAMEWYAFYRFYCVAKTKTKVVFCHQQTEHGRMYGLGPSIQQSEFGAYGVGLSNQNTEHGRMNGLGPSIQQSEFAAYGVGSSNQNTEHGRIYGLGTSIQQSEFGVYGVGSSNQNTEHGRMYGFGHRINIPWVRNLS